MGGGWSVPRAGRLIPGKETWCPLHRGLGGLQGWSGQVWEILSPPGFGPRTIQPVASCFVMTFSGQFPYK